MFDLHTSHLLQGHHSPPRLGQSHSVWQVAEPTRFIHLMAYKGEQMEMFDEKEAHLKNSLHF